MALTGVKSPRVPDPDLYTHQELVESQFSPKCVSTACAGMPDRKPGKLGVLTVLAALVVSQAMRPSGKRICTRLSPASNVFVYGVPSSRSRVSEPFLAKRTFGMSALG